jgi:long-chain acyl-CoA synthetase
MERIARGDNMPEKPWHGSRWPHGVPYEISDYERPLFSLLDATAQEFPDHTYTIFEGAVRTFSQVKDSADRVAGFLAGKGIEPGDRIAMFLPNVPHYPEIFFGILKAGGTAVTCNPLYTIPELHFQLKDTGARALFVLDHPGFYPTALEALKETDVETVVICSVKSHLPPLKRFLGSLLGKLPKADSHEPGHLLYDHVIASSRPEPPGVDINPMEDPALILYTGGTTGVPKGAVLSHANLLSNIRCTEEWVRISENPGDPPTKPDKGGDHAYLGVLPWYHSFGLALVMLASCHAAVRLVCIPDPRAGNPPFTHVLRAIEKYRITAIVAVPTIYSAIIHHPLTHKFDLSSIVGCASGAAPLPVEVIRQFEERTGAVIFEGYGLSETSPILTMNPTNTEQRKIGTVGPPAPGTDIRILDLEEGTREVLQGQDGEIAASGPQIMLGYWKRPEADAEVFRQIDGRRYFLTGDIGHLDEDGFLVITDRKKDLILVGGFNAYPREIEEVLYTHPKVAQAAVIGVPDPHSGEAVKAFLQLKPGENATEEEFREFCRKELAGYKRPKEFEFRESLPTSIIGKVLRRALREEELEKRAPALPILSPLAHTPFIWVFKPGPCGVS